MSLGSYIGVFYTNQYQELVCAGSIIWEGETTSVAAWGSEAGMNNGFQAGENFTFGIIDPNSGENVYTTEANYFLGNEIYSCNALAGLSSISFNSSDSECSDNDNLMSPLDCSTASVVFGCNEDSF